MGIVRGKVVIKDIQGNQVREHQVEEGILSQDIMGQRHLGLGSQELLRIRKVAVEEGILGMLVVEGDILGKQAAEVGIQVEEGNLVRERNPAEVGSQREDNLLGDNRQGDSLAEDIDVGKLMAEASSQVQTS